MCVPMLSNCYILACTYTLLPLLLRPVPAAQCHCFCTLYSNKMHRVPAPSSCVHTLYPIDTHGSAAGPHRIMERAKQTYVQTGNTFALLQTV